MKPRPRAKLTFTWSGTRSPWHFVRQNEIIEVLNGWPDGTYGWEKDRWALEQLLMVGSAVGYGAAAQLATWIQALVLGFEPIEKFRRMREERLRSMAEYEKERSAKR